MHLAFLPRALPRPTATLTSRALRSPLNLSPNAPHIFYDVAVDVRPTVVPPLFPSTLSKRLVEHEEDHRRRNIAFAFGVAFFLHATPLSVDLSWTLLANMYVYSSNGEEIECVFLIGDGRSISRTRQ